MNFLAVTMTAGLMFVVPAVSFREVHRSSRPWESTWNLEIPR